MLIIGTRRSWWW